jgi:hypothetical protein
VRVLRSAGERHDRRLERQRADLSATKERIVVTVMLRGSSSPADNSTPGFAGIAADYRLDPVAGLKPARGSLTREHFDKENGDVFAGRGAAD